MTSFTSATTSSGSRTGLTSLLLVALAACSGQEPPCPEDERAITHGVYGEVVYRTFDDPKTPLYDVLIHVSSFGGATVDARSNEDGFYEIALPDGTAHYAVCSEFANVGCESDVTVSNVVRLDLTVLEGQVFWDVDNFGKCVP